MQPSSLGRDFGSNGPLWSLAFEVVYYLLYPLWLTVRRWSAMAAYAGVPLASLALMVVLPWPYASAVVGWYPAWVCGAGLVELAIRGVMPGVVPAVGLFAAGLAGYLSVGARPLQVLGAVMFAGAAACAWSRLNERAGGSAFKVAEYLGQRSYTIYVMHFPILALFSAATIEIAGGRPLHGWIAVSGAAAALGLCVGLFEMCERHFLHQRLQLERAAAA
jgi:peptidoglycan/LPS O-acetylase OafA/YrhL